MVSSKEKNDLLFEAIEFDFDFMVQDAINSGANVNARDYFDRTPLHIATSEENIGIVYTLLDNDADPNLFDESGNTALHDALRDGGRYSLQIAETLISAGAKGDIENEDGETPLSLAVSKGYTDIVQLLLDAVSNPLTPLLNVSKEIEIAISKNHMDILQLLLEYRSKSGYFVAGHRLTKGWKPEGFFDIEFK